MANEINNGGPAFPGQPAFSAADDLATSENIGAPGMSLRDWLAGQAIASGQLKYSGLTDAQIVARFGEGRTNISPEEIMAANAYRVADAMIAARATGAGK